MRIPVFHGEFTEVYGTEVQALNQAQYLLGRVDQINLVSFRLFLDVWGDTTGGLGLVFLAANTWKERLGLWSPMHANGSRARHTGRSLWKLLREDFLASNRFGLEQRGGDPYSDEDGVDQDCGYCASRLRRSGFRIWKESFFHLVGTGSQLPDLMSMPGELNRLENVRFLRILGKRDHESVRTSYDFFALLPRGALFGIAFPESADAGLLMIGLSHGEPLEILEYGRYGLICPACALGSFGGEVEQIRELTDSEVYDRRSEPLRSCRARYSKNVIGLRSRNRLSNE